MKEEPSLQIFTQRLLSPVTEIGRYLVCVFLYYSLGFGLTLPSGPKIDQKENLLPILALMAFFIPVCPIRYARLTDMELVNCIKVHLNSLSVDLVLRHGPLYFRIFKFEALGPILLFLIKELKPGIFSEASSGKKKLVSHQI